MNTALALTAAYHGATVANHVEVVNLKKTDGKLSGAEVRDTLTGKSWSIRAKGIINATGPFAGKLNNGTV
jgi:glycerol-3-phosphate dehydrogenase